MKPLNLSAILALLSCGCGCASSPPTQFYTLDVVPGEHESRPLHAPIRVSIVHIPAVLDRQEIVRESGAARLTVSNQHRWGAPLGEMIRRVLTQDLLDRLPSHAVLLPEQPAPPQSWEVVIDVLKFQADQSGHIVLTGSWSLVPQGSSTPALSEPIRITIAAATQDYGAEVQAMSHTVGQLSDRIASVLAQTNETSHP